MAYSKDSRVCATLLQMRMAEQAEEMRQAEETAAIAARNQEIARKAAASEARRLKMEADVQVSPLGPTHSVPAAFTAMGS